MLLWVWKTSNSKHELFVFLLCFFLYLKLEICQDIFCLSTTRAKKENVEMNLCCWRLNPWWKQREKLRQLDSLSWFLVGIYIERTRPILRPLRCWFVDPQSWLEPGDCKVPVMYWLVKHGHMDQNHHTLIWTLSGPCRWCWKFLRSQIWRRSPRATICLPGGNLWGKVSVTDVSDNIWPLLHVKGCFSWL